MKRGHKRQTSIPGAVTAVFAHRFEIESGDGGLLADIGWEAVGLVGLQEGDKVTLKGEREPSETKVTEIAKAAGKPIRVEHKKKHDDGEPHDDQHPGDAIAAVTREGFETTGEPRRKPRHFEILGRSTKGNFTEFHVEIGGTVRNYIRPIFMKRSGRGPCPRNRLISSPSRVRKFPGASVSKWYPATRVARCRSR